MPNLWAVLEEVRRSNESLTGKWRLRKALEEVLVNACLRIEIVDKGTAEKCCAATLLTIIDTLCLRYWCLVLLVPDLDDA